MNHVAFLIASSPGHRAGEVGKAIFLIVAGIVIFGGAAAVLVAIPATFAALRSHLPWLVVIWGISGIVLLLLAYISADRSLYFAGGIDLGIFLAAWFFAAAMDAYLPGWRRPTQPVYAIL
jgi:hypothetical protein